jgi:lipopolysaccharide export system permease protein
MSRLPIRKVDLLVLSEFIPFFLMGVAAFTLLMVAVTLFREILRYIADYGLSVTQVGIFFFLALPQTVAYTFPMAVLFAGLLSFGRMSDTNQITAMRAGGIGFFRIILPALILTWFIVLCTFILSEKVAPQSSRAAREYIHNALVDKGISVQETDISYMDEEAGWLFAAASGEGNVFNDVKWWDFSRPGEFTLYTADEGVWHMGRWEFHDAEVVHINIGEEEASAVEMVRDGEEGLERLARNGNVVRFMTTPTLEMQISRTPSDILAESSRDLEEMSLQELRSYLHSPEIQSHSEAYIRKVQGTYQMKISVPFASIFFMLIAAPLGLTPQRSTSTMGIGFSMVLVFIYYLLTTFSVKIAESGIMPPVLAAWLPNLLFLFAGIILNGRFYVKSG